MLPFINIHTHKIARNELSIVNLNYDEKIVENISYSFGLHPWDIGKVSENEVVEKLENYSKSKKIVAIGEIGLDRAIETVLDLQKKYFIDQLEIAEKYKLPVIIHAVRSNADLLQIRKQQRNSSAWILHGFRGSSQDARQFINKNCYLSFGEALLYNKKLQKVLQQINIGNIFLETDNSSILISEVYNKAANLLNINLEDLKQQLYSNFIKVFDTK